jgi:hypothetical protein
MNKRSIYIVVVILFLATSGFIVMKYQNKKREYEARIYELLPRNNSSANYADWVTVKNNAKTLFGKISANENEPGIKNKIGCIVLTGGKDHWSLYIL